MAELGIKRSDNLGKEILTILTNHCEWWTRSLLELVGRYQGEEKIGVRLQVLQIQNSIFQQHHIFRSRLTAARQKILCKSLVIKTQCGLSCTLSALTHESV